MATILAVLGGLFFIGLGVRSILTRRASLDWHIGNGEPRLDEPPTELRGAWAMAAGVLSVGTGAAIIVKWVF